MFGILSPSGMTATSCEPSVDDSGGYVREADL